MEPYILEVENLTAAFGSREVLSGIGCNSQAFIMQSLRTFPTIFCHFHILFGNNHALLLNI